ncbi:MAG: response regulator [bacterium]|nr:response regulator [bacterium]
MKINVAILEDNPITAQDLKEILEDNDIQVTKTFYTAEDAINELDSTPADIWLVDIKLKGQLTGIDFAKELTSKKQVPFVYLTANSDKDSVEKAISTDPASFLTKPFDDKDLVIAIELAFKKNLNSNTRNNTNDLPFVFLKSGNRFMKVMFDKIHYLEADGSYCKVVTEDKEYTLSCNLNHFSSNINNGSFLRIHKSYSVNVESISGLDNDYVYVLNRDLPIGRVYKNDVKSLLKKFS